MQPFVLHKIAGFISFSFLHLKINLSYNFAFHSYRRVVFLENMTKEKKKRRVRQTTTQSPPFNAILRHLQDVVNNKITTQLTN